jgi:hypothetical protein
VPVSYISGAWSDDDVRIELELRKATMSFAQVAAPGLIPVNVAIPSGGVFRSTRCSLRVHVRTDEIAVGVEFDNPSANLCVRLMERGDYDRARQVAAEALAVHNANSWVTNVGQKFVQYLNDPTLLMLSRYIQMRVGDVGRSRNSWWSLMDVFARMADGMIISGELAARKGRHRHALTFLLNAANLARHAPPLFNEGFKLLVSRLQQYSRQEGRTAEISAGEARRAQDVLDKLDAYTPFMDVDSITLTFAGADLSNLEESQHAVDLDSADWFHVDVPAEAAPIELRPTQAF